MPRTGSRPGAPRPNSRTPALARSVQQYLAAWRWRREVERRLKSVSLTFPQWFVLDATQRLVHEEKDAVNQNAVARRTELDRMTVSQIMTTLAEQGHVDRDTDRSGRGYRIWVTTKGERTLALADECLSSPAG